LLELKDVNLASIDIQANRVVDLTEVREALKGIIIIPAITRAKVLYSNFYQEKVNDLVESGSFGNLQNLLQEAEEIIQKLYPKSSHEEQALTKFMQNRSILPEFVNLFADAQTNITRSHKANNLIPQDQPAVDNQDNKKATKILKILYERLILKKKVKELAVKYGCRESKISKIVRKFANDPDSICDNQSAQHPTRRKLLTHHIEYLKDLLNNIL